MRQHSAAPRLAGLEVLRFIAALAVLVWHYQHFMYTGAQRAGYDIARSPFYDLLAPFYVRGYVGVQLFWCLSGFIFAWKYQAAIATRRVGGWSFAVRRFSRLYPLHFVTLLYVAALQPCYAALHGGADFVYAFNNLRYFILNLFFANYWGFQSGYSFNGPTWSISLEILVYIVFFVLCRFTKRSWQRDLSLAMGAAVVSMLAWPLFHSKLQIAQAITFFYFGVMAARMHAVLLALSPARRRAWGMMAWLAIVVALGLIASGVLRVLGEFVVFPVMTLLFALWEVPAGWMRRGAVFLGNMTYSSYLMHFPMQLTAMLIFAHFAIDPATLFFHRAFFLAYLGAVLIVAALVYRWFEVPAQAWLRARLDGRASVNAVKSA